jgi:hypothetical protein
MHKAFEYEVKYDSKGKAVERRWSVGPVLVTSAAALLLALTGHTVWSGITTLLKAVKSW